MSALLTFGEGNSKLGQEIATFSIPAGWACPGARDCLAKANRETGKITDGKDQEFRCFSVSMEARLPSVRQSRWRNWELLKACKNRRQIFELLCESLPNAPIVRIHVGGDFYSESYFLAWCDTARVFPFITFYGYTKSLPYWVNNLASVPGNLRLVASEGGRWDHLIKEHGLRSAKVVLDPREAEVLGLAVDHDDSHAYAGSDSFALLLHGTQAKGTVAAKALSALRSAGWKGYSKAA